MASGRVSVRCGLMPQLPCHSAVRPLPAHPTTCPWNGSTKFAVLLRAYTGGMAQPRGRPRGPAALDYTKVTSRYHTIALPSVCSPLPNANANAKAGSFFATANTLAKWIVMTVAAAQHLAPRREFCRCAVQPLVPRRERIWCAVLGLSQIMLGKSQIFLPRAFPSSRLEGVDLFLPDCRHLTSAYGYMCQG